MAKIVAAVSALREAYKAATFENASFHLPGSHNDDTEAIKKATDLYMKTWVLPRIRRAIVDLDPCPTCKGKGHVWRDVEEGVKAETCTLCKGHGSTLVIGLK